MQNRAVGRRGVARIALGIGLFSALMLVEGARTELAAQAAADGKKIYGTVCAACHQASGEGVPNMFPPVAGSEWVTENSERLIKVLLHGLTGEIEVAGEVYSGMMPPWAGSLKDAEIAAVATYIRTNFGNKASAITADEVARVRAANTARKTPWTAKELALSTATKK